MKKKKTKAPWVRVRGLLNPNHIHQGTSVTTTYKQNKTPTVVSSTPSFFVPVSDGTMMTDLVTPGYRKLSAQGKIIVSPMSQVFNDFVIEGFNGQIYAANFAYTTTPPTGSFLNNKIDVFDYLLWSSLSVFPDVPVIDFEKIKIDASNAAIANSHQRDVLGFVDLAEMHKTVDMIHGNFSRLENIIRGLPIKKLGKRKYSKNGSGFMQKYKPTTVAGKAADASGLWLEWHYGVIPTMQSIEGLMNVLKDQSVPKRQTYRGSDSIHTIDESSKSSVQKTTIDGVTPLCTYVSGLKYEVNSYARAGLITEFRPSTRGRLGMETRDLPTAAYELIPFSFVVDWFMDFNTAIEAATPVKGWSSLGSWLTFHKEEILTYNRYTTGGSFSKVVSGITKTEQVFPHASTMTLIKRSKTRTPGINAGFPHLDSKFKSFTHAISALALTISIGNSKLNKRAYHL